MYPTYISLQSSHIQKRTKKGKCEVVHMHKMQACKGSRDRAPVSLSLVTDWSWEFGLTPTLLYPQEGDAGVYWIGDCAGPRDGVDVVRGKIPFPLPGIEGKFSDHSLVTGRRGRIRKQLLDDLKGARGYFSWKLISDSNFFHFRAFNFCNTKNNIVLVVIDLWLRQRKERSNGDRKHSVRHFKLVVRYGRRIRGTDCILRAGKKNS